VWDRLRKQIALERQQLHRLLDTSRPFIEQCASRPPNSAELFALAATLHSFYNGFENIFKRIAVELDGGLRETSFGIGSFWTLWRGQVTTGLPSSPNK
jgi:hypothetical protein